ncbi:UNVERIFIED_CONTAM: 4-aminobutyrate aminotransferase-like enzyme [Jeotgalibacillus campisalis]
MTSVAASTAPGMRRPLWVPLTTQHDFPDRSHTAVNAQGVVFSTSGGAANDAVMKLARQFIALNGQPERKLIVGLKGRIAGVIAEPVLGSGAEAVPDDFIASLQQHRQDHGFLLVADEVATGFARVGGWFASDEWVQRPDVIVNTLYKQVAPGIHEARALVQPGPGRIQLLPALTYTEENSAELQAAINVGLAGAHADGVFR